MAATTKELLEAVFSVRSVLMLYDYYERQLRLRQSLETLVRRVRSWSKEFISGQTPAGKSVNTEAENIVGIRYQATTGEDTADREDPVRAIVNCRVCGLAIAL
jgi:hypothetical protein